MRCNGLGVPAEAANPVVEIIHHDQHDVGSRSGCGVRLLCRQRRQGNGQGCSARQGLQAL